MSIWHTRQNKLRRIPRQNFIILRVQFDIVFLKIEIELVCTKYLGNLDQLIIIVMAMEERFFPEDLERKDT
jgi:hypothetical protein